LADGEGASEVAEQEVARAGVEVRRTRCRALLPVSRPMGLARAEADVRITNDPLFQ
jgi:hypothetical protein